MGGSRRMNDKALHIRNIGKEGKNLQAVNKSMRLLPAALDLKGKEGAPAIGKIPLIQLMVRVIRQGWVIDLFNLRVAA